MPNGLILLLVLLMPAVFLLRFCSQGPIYPQVKIQAQHTVRRGEYIDRIATGYRNVTSEAIVLANRNMLQVKFEETCGPLKVSYVNNPRRRGTFCNERFHDAFKNTLKPGWVLQIPETSAPAQVQDAIRDYTNPSDVVDVVIDATGSMGNNRAQVAQFYLAALKQHGRKVKAVYLFRDHKVWSVYDAQEIEKEVGATGDFENTYEALRKAASDHPDKIIVISDEVGDDWPSDMTKLRELPPVIANCITDDPHSCTSSFPRLARETHGKYVAMSATSYTH
jgi:hypothetical protein